jgi:hypothetical protein
MNATAFGDRPKEVVTTENLLHDAAERVGRIREGRMAVHLHMSRLLPHNREEAKIRIAFRIFEQQVDLYRGQIFLLTNSDIMLICKDASVEDLETYVNKMRAMFSKDPLTYDVEGEEGDRFVTYYDLEFEYDAFFTLCGQLVAEAKKRIARDRAAPSIQELDAKSLTAVLERIASTDVAGVVRRQPCVRISEKNAAETMFQEFFISIGDLQKVLAPDVNLLSNRWLFQHLSQALDLQVLSTLRTAGFRRLPAAFSVNLNMSTVDTPAFQQFHHSLGNRAGLFVELQLVDIFNDLDGFFRTRDQLRERGCVTVLDGINALTLQFMDAELYETDFVKVTWSPDMADIVQSDEICRSLAPVGFERIILSRCDTETSIRWGLDHGIRHFQGRYLDAMVGAVTMTQCDKASACTLAQCIARHGVISGKLRTDCGNNAMLDSFPALKAIR